MFFCFCHRIVHYILHFFELAYKDKNKERRNAYISSFDENLMDFGGFVQVLIMRDPLMPPGLRQQFPQREPQPVLLLLRALLP